MSELHRVYLNIGSNIEPELHLPKTMGLLRQYGQVQAVSTAWETHAIGSNGPNFLNACVLFLSPLRFPELKELIIQPIEAALGRVRSEDKYAPRTIDIDVVLFDGEPLNAELWTNAFIVVPLAEINPGHRHPFIHETLAQVAERMRHETWIMARPGVLSSI